ncbi:MAG: glutaredoxin family protein [Promethearchaeota archaeon]
MTLNSIKIPGKIVNVEGTNHSGHEIFMFAISTCQWCKKGKAWMSEKGYTYSYVDIDKIPLEEKNKLKADLKDEFKTRLSFPFVIVDKREVSAGYNPSEWEILLK